DETNLHTSLEVRVSRETRLVTHAESAVILPNDTLNDLGREATADRGGAHANLRGLRRVPAAEAAVAGAEALAGAGARAVTERAPPTEADTLAATAAAFTDARQTETARAVRVADLVAEHVAHGADRVRA